MTEKNDTHEQPQQEGLTANVRTIAKVKTKEYFRNVKNVRCFPIVRYCILEGLVEK